jgi:hypothetical protein
MAVKCYETLRNGDAVERGVVDVLRAEARAAVRPALAATVVVAAYLAWAGGGLWPVAVRAVGAFLLALALHAAVVLVGTAVLRARERADADADPLVAGE